MTRFAALALALAAAGWAGAQDDASKEDLKKLQGKWETVTVVHNGEVQKPEKRSPWVFEGNKLKYPAFDTEDEIKLDATLAPKTMDVRVVRKGQKTEELKAIYELAGDTLKICVDVGGKGRPTAFESKADSGHRLVTLKRVKE